MGNRDENRSAMLPLPVQYQLRETLFPSMIQPTVTTIAITSGTPVMLSGSALEGRIGFWLRNENAYDAAEMVRVNSSPTSGDGVGFPIWGGETVQPFFVPAPSGTLMYASAQGADATVSMLEI